jgi:hypothetical protein
MDKLNPDYFNTDRSHLSMVKMINKLVDTVNEQQKEIKKLNREIKFQKKNNNNWLHKEQTNKYGWPN